MLSKRCGEGDHVADSVEPGLGLEFGCVKVEERFAGEGDAHSAVLLERDRVADEWPHSPAGAVGIASPPLLGPEPRAHHSGPDPPDFIEGDLLAKPMLHRGEVPAAILRVVGIARPGRDPFAELVAEQSVRLEFVKAMLLVAEALCDFF